MNGISIGNKASAGLLKMLERQFEDAKGNTSNANEVANTPAYVNHKGASVSNNSDGGKSAIGRIGEIYNTFSNIGSLFGGGESDNE